MPEQPQYSEQIEYERLLLYRINDIDNAIKFGGDGVKELGSLWAKLKKDIREPIQKDIEAVTLQAEAEIKKLKESIYNKPSELGLPSDISLAHKKQVLDAASRPINTQATQRVVQIIIDQLDDMNLLLKQARRVPTATKARIEGDK